MLICREKAELAERMEKEKQEIKDKLEKENQGKIKSILIIKTQTNSEKASIEKPFIFLYLNCQRCVLKPLNLTKSNYFVS